MGSAVKGGLGLGIAVVIVNAITYAAGLHTNSAGNWLLPVYIALNIGFIVAVLRKSRNDNGYGKQILNSLVLGAIAAVILSVGTMVLLAVVFPEAHAETVAYQIEKTEMMDLPEEQIEAQIKMLESIPVTLQIVLGGVMTVLTSLVVGLIAAIFLKKK